MGPNKERLHAEVEGLGMANWHVAAIVHAMIEAGTVVKLECQLPDCVYPQSRGFDKQKGRRGHNKRGLIIDHIQPRLRGGSHRPENLQLLHADCNLRRATGWVQTAETRVRMSEARKQAWAEGKYDNAFSKRKPGWNSTPRHGGMGGRGLNEEAVREARRRHAAGESLTTISKDLGVAIATVRRAILGLGSYGKIR